MDEEAWEVSLCLFGHLGCRLPVTNMAMWCLAASGWAVIFAINGKGLLEDSYGVPESAAKSPIRD